MADDDNYSAGAELNADQIVKFFTSIGFKMQGFKEEGIEGQHVSFIIKEKSLSVAEMNDRFHYLFEHGKHDG